MFGLFFSGRTARPLRLYQLIAHVNQRNEIDQPLERAGAGIVLVVRADNRNTAARIAWGSVAARGHDLTKVVIADTVEIEDLDEQGRPAYGLLNAI